jgi:methionyl-tRNA formyltransferase
MLKIVFMGSPEFAVPSLVALHQQETIVGVVTQPDRQAGRGRALSAPPVKARADALGLKSIQPASLKTEQVLQQIIAWNPDLIVVAAFGQILPESILNIPRLGAINVHASLLPRWRGAAPIQAAILHGDEQTGITIMLMDPGLDTGPIVAQQPTPIQSRETAGDLALRLADIGARLLIKTLPLIAKGEIRPRPQNESEATYAPMLRKSDGILDPDQSAEQLDRKVRAFQPWPGTFLEWHGGRLIVNETHVEAVDSDRMGDIRSVQGYPAIVTAQGLLVLDKVQPPGKRSMDGAAFLRGAPEFLESRIIKPI